MRWGDGAVVVGSPTVGENSEGEGWWGFEDGLFFFLLMEYGTRNGGSQFRARNKKKAGWCWRGDRGLDLVRWMVG